MVDITESLEVLKHRVKKIAPGARVSIREYNSYVALVVTRGYTTRFYDIQYPDIKYSSYWINETIEKVKEDF